MELKISNNLKIFFIYTAAALLLGYMSELFLVNDELVLAHYNGQFADDLLYKMLEWNQKWRWVTYVLLPLISIIKFSLISLCIYAGVYMANYPIRLSKIFQIVLLSEFIFFVPILIKLFWFTLIQTDYSLIDLQFFMPLSILQIYDPTYVQSWLVYPLTILNAFELAYWIILSFLLGKELNKDFDNMFRLVSSSYGLCLFLWVVIITFINVSLS